MIRFYLTKSTMMFKHKDRFEISERCTIGHNLSHTETVGMFNEKEEAFRNLEGYRTELIEIVRPEGVLYCVTEYFIEEKEYDEESNCINDGNILGSTDMIIELNEADTDRKIDEFDNFCDAETALQDCGGKAYIVFH